MNYDRKPVAYMRWSSSLSFGVPDHSLVELCVPPSCRTNLPVFDGSLTSFNVRADEDYDLVVTDHQRDLDERVQADVLGRRHPLISSKVIKPIPQPFLCKPSGLEPTCLGEGRMWTPTPHLASLETVK